MPRPLRPIFTGARTVTTWLWTPERRWLLLLAAALVAFGTFLEISEELIEDDELARIDRSILAYVTSLRRPWLTISVIDLTALGSLTLLGLAMVSAAVPLARIGDVRGALQLVIAVLGAGLWTLLTKGYFARARPNVVDPLLEVPGFSFPSGHSSGAAALYVTLAVVLGRHLRTLRGKLWLLAATSTLAILIGLSRIYLGVHYPSDVASGLAFGSGWALLLSAAFEWRRLRGQKSPNS